MLCLGVRLIGLVILEGLRLFETLQDLIHAHLGHRERVRRYRKADIAARLGA